AQRGGPGRPGPGPAQPQPAAGAAQRRRRPAAAPARAHPRHCQPGGRQLRRASAGALPLAAGTPAGASARPLVTTLISHPLPILALGLALGPRVVPPKLLLAGMLFALLPDADMLAFKFGIAYADAFGHRGFSHSLLFAGLAGVLGALGCRLLG